MGCMSDSDITNIIKEGLQLIDSGISLEQLSKEMQLNEVEAWDSLVAINFSIYIEKQFNLAEGSFMVVGQESIGKVIEIIRASSKGGPQSI